MSPLKTPGVYIVEKNAFPNSVVEVATAVPAFIGYTEKAENGSKSLINLPFRISSLAEYQQYFGKAPCKNFRLVKTDINSLGLSALKDPGKIDALKNGTEEIFKRSEPDDIQYYGVTRNHQFNLYYQLLFFFANGGGPCYIVSVNVGYKQDSFSYEALAGGIEPLLKEQEPTMVIIPEAVYLEEQECYDLQTAVLRHCATMQNRIAILDIYHGDKSRKDQEAGDVINAFREKTGTEFLNYGAAYYPWLNTAVISEKNLGINSVSNIEDLQNILKSEAVFQNDEKRTQQLVNLAERITKEGPESPSEKEGIHKILLEQSVAYATIMKKIAHDINLLPPSSAMAGIYTLVDSTREVWKAPANIGLSSVISPSVDISHADQEDLNLPPDGKAINAIRYFTGEGIKVWGARTLDGNSSDWRYINVRRTVIMLEESIKCAAGAFVFEPNTAITWVTVRSMVGNFLNGIWKRGGLAGAVPEDAFTVSVGLGETMTPEDLLEGIMRITVLVAVVRPAEFIEITFQQQMQKS